MTMFQPMPDLTAEQYVALRDDIAKNGVIVPVVVDQHGRLLDGHNRRRIAAELGIDCPQEVREVNDDEAAMELAVTLNCARRHLSREQVREVIRGEINRRPDDSDRSIAKRVGCSPSTVGSVRKEAEAPDVESSTVTLEQLRESEQRIEESVEAARAALFSLVGMALTNRISVTETVGALTMARLRFARRDRVSPEATELFLKMVFDYVIEAATWDETVEQFPPAPDADPSPQFRTMLLDSIVSMGNQDHPADSPRTVGDR